MRELQFTRVFATLIFAGICLTLALAPQFSATASLLLAKGMDALHFPAGCIAALLVMWNLGHRPRCYLLAAVLLIVFTVLLEYLQSQTGRSASLDDGISGLLGAAAGLLIFFLWQNAAPMWRLAFGGCVSLVLFLSVQPIYELIRADQYRYQQFPVLSDFEQPLDLPLWRGYQGTQIERTNQSCEGNWGLAVRLGPKRWPGITLRLRGLDLRGYQQISFCLYNPGDEFLLEMAFYDELAYNEYGQRSNQYFVAKPGWHRVTLPFKTLRSNNQARDMQFDKPVRLTLLTSKTRSRSFVIDNLRLE